MQMTPASPPASPSEPHGRRAASQAGFSFLEVLMALAILLVGCVGVMALFALGAQEYVERRIESKVQAVRGEVLNLAQDAVDQSAPGALPKKITDYELSQRNYTLDIVFAPSPFGGPRFSATALLRFRGEVVKVLPPLSLTRSTLDPAALDPDAAPR